MKYVLHLQFLWLAFSRGSDAPRRPPLKREIIRRIFRLADVCLPIASLSVSSGEEVFVTQKPGYFPWICTPPIKFHLLPFLRTNFARLEITITSHDQGWTDLPGTSDTYFELVVYASDRVDGFLATEPKLGVIDGEERSLVWPFRWNRSANWEWYTETSDFLASHEVWRFVKADDVVCLRVCAKYPGWVNYAKNAKFRFLRFFDVCDVD